MKIPRLVRWVVSTITFFLMLAAGCLVCYGIGWISPVTRMLIDQDKQTFFIFALVGFVQIIAICLVVIVTFIVIVAISYIDDVIFKGTK